MVQLILKFQNSLCKMYLAKSKKRTSIKSIIRPNPYTKEDNDNKAFQRKIEEKPHHTQL